MIPSINIAIKNGQLGQILQTKDGILGMVCTGLATNNLLNTPVLLTSLEDYLALGYATLAGTWAKVTTTVTITAAAHGLVTGNTINITVTSDAAGLPLGAYVVTVLTASTYTVTCTAGGAASGTATTTTYAITDTFALKHVTEFYTEAGRGALLYLLLVAETQTMVQTVDNTFAAGGRKLLDFAAGAITVMGVVRNPTGEATIGTNFFRADVIAAIAGATAMITAQRNAHVPIRVILGGRLDTVSQVPQDLKAMSSNGVAVVAGDTNSTSLNAAVGLVLGRIAKAAVSTSIARVKDGALVGINDAFIGAVRSEAFSQRAVLIDKGAITLTSYAQRAGYYLSDDQMCALPTDDFTNLVSGRTVDKAQRISYQVYVDELHNSVPIDLASGKISPEVIKSMEGKIEYAVRTAMANELSGFDAYIDPNQNILATSKLVINEGIVPFGYLRRIDIQLGLNNPFQ